MNSEALESFQKVVSKADGKEGTSEKLRLSEAYSGIARLALASGDKEKNEEYLKKAHEIDTECLNACDLRGRELEAEGELEEAENMYRERLALIGRLKKAYGEKHEDDHVQVIGKVIGTVSADEIPDEVFMVHGWDMNENMDEIDIVESSCFVSEAHANAELDRMKIVQPRDEWIINRWRIDETHWQEGFERV